VTTEYSTLCGFVCLAICQAVQFLTQFVTDAGKHVGKQHCASKDECRAEPVNGTEGVLKVRDGDEQREEFTKRQDQRYGQRCTVERQYKH